MGPKRVASSRRTVVNYSLLFTLVFLIRFLLALSYCYHHYYSITLTQRFGARVRKGCREGLVASEDLGLSGADTASWRLVRRSDLRNYVKYLISPRQRISPSTRTSSKHPCYPQYQKPRARRSPKVLNHIPNHYRFMMSPYIAYIPVSYIYNLGGGHLSNPKP